MGPDCHFPSLSAEGRLRPIPFLATANKPKTLYLQEFYSTRKPEIARAITNC